MSTGQGPPTLLGTGTWGTMAQERKVPVLWGPNIPVLWEPNILGPSAMGCATSDSLLEHDIAPEVWPPHWE